MSLKETIQEFKEFAIKGNVVDMAVGVIIGGAFGKIVTSFVNDLIMPIIGKLHRRRRFQPALSASGRQSLCHPCRCTGGNRNHRIRLLSHAGA